MAWPNWPGTANGTSSPHWGTNVQLYVWAAIAGGSEMVWGPSPLSRLNAGNVWASPTTEGPAPPAGTVWVDIGCDVLSLTVHIGTDDVAPFANVADAGTADILLRDTNRQYDPMNPDSPYQFGGQTRLTEGAAIKIFAETDNGGSIERWDLFTGTVDTWSTDWQANPGNRTAHVVASDCVKELAGLDWGEQPAAGSGDYQQGRIQRILAHYGWTGPTVLDAPYDRYQATTLAQSAWELLGRVATDSNGFLHIDGSGSIATAGSNRWTVKDPTVTIAVGCLDGIADIVLDVEVATSEIQNSVSASRTGGTMSTYRNATSVAQYGERGAPKRTDLGLYQDADVKRYADSILATRAFPKGRLNSVVVRPQLEPFYWRHVFRTQSYLGKEAVNVFWQPPESGAALYQAKGRPFGVEHTIKRRAWDVRWSLALADVFARRFTAGPHARDKLNDGNVLT